MTYTYSISGIKCNGCAGHVKEQIEKHPDVTQVEISGLALYNIYRKYKEAVISMNQHISIDELQLFLDKDSQYSGRYAISQAKWVSIIQEIG
ncbi:MAG: heavy-metal-associated domain-containing protein [Flavobacteriales bacterium]|nr:heavy-metal-associated domain-containing protein [Flavobacteriales bacterium]